MVVLLALGLGYLLGSIPWAWLAGKTAGVDLRQAGSGNVGTANLSREVGFTLSVVTFFLDVAKALAAVWIAAGWGEAAQVAAGWGAIVGHGWPVWLRFVGGRAQSVVLAAGLILAPVGTLIILPILGVGLFVSRLASSWLVAGPVYVVSAFVIDGVTGGVYVVGGVVLSIARRLTGSPMLQRAPLRRAWRTRLIHDREP